MSQAAEDQRRKILEHFTSMAAPFARLPAHSSESSVRLIREAVDVGPDDTVLDVACGPGLIACALAETARHVTGIDLVPAMIEQARALQQERKLTNLAWRLGDVSALPFPDGSFSLAFTRYSFHHMIDPAGAFAEMTRATAPGGRVAVVDVYTTGPEQAEAYDRLEKLRDPSHVRALGLEELKGLFVQAGLEDVAATTYRLEVELEELLGTSPAEPAAAEEIRRLFAEDVGRDRLGFGARRDNDEIHVGFPTVIVVGRKNG